MTIFLFAGPTLSADDARDVLPSVVVLPPAARGDVYRACRNNPKVIAICDGYFDHHLSIWHKEILWALSNGVSVYGAASMGALRAAELSSFGMIGVGTIFEQYRSGALEDDDEVAIVHDEAAFGYRPRSEALVNIRATLQHACEVGVVSESTARLVIEAAKALFYPDRSYTRAIQLAQKGARVPELERLKVWIDQNPRVDQKRLDALAMLARVREDDEAQGTTRSRVAFRFEHTNAWRAFRHATDSEPNEWGATSAPALGSRELSVTRSEVHVHAMERTLALVLAELAQEAPEASEVQRRSERFRREHELHSLERTQAWLEKHDLSQEAFTLLMYNEVLIERFRASARELVAEQMRSTIQALNLEPWP